MTDIPAVKFVDDPEKGIIEGLILPLGGPVAGGKDLTGTFFSERTDFALDWFPEGGRPGLYHHGADAQFGIRPIGREIKSWQEDGKGVWVRAQLDKAHAYWSEVKGLIDKGLLFMSSGSVDHLVEATKSGEIVRWPWVEWTLTPIPANPEAVVRAVRSVEPPDPVKGLLAALIEQLTPQAMHDAAMAAGASCESYEEKDEPAPLLAEAGKSVEPFDIEAFADRLVASASAAAIAAVKARLEP